MDKPQYELAEQDYVQGMKYKDIAAKYNVSINTVKSWKTRYKWCKDKKVCIQNEKVRTQRTRREAEVQRKKEKVISKAIEKVIENEELTDKEKIFCVDYSKRHNATRAYMKAYGGTYYSCAVEGCKKLRLPKIKACLNMLLEEELNYEYLQKGIIQKYKDIAFSDIKDYIEFGTLDIPEQDSEGNIKFDAKGDEITKKESFAYFKDSNMVDGSIITEVSMVNGGIRLKFADKMKAMEELRKMRSLLTEEEKARLDFEYKQLQNEKVKADIAKTKAEINRISGVEDGKEVEDDGFIDALNGTAQDDWKDFEGVEENSGNEEV